jgi:hypothetical protein
MVSQPTGSPASLAHRSTDCADPVVRSNGSHAAGGAGVFSSVETSPAANVGHDTANVGHDTPSVGHNTVNVGHAAISG